MKGRRGEAKVGGVLCLLPVNMWLQRVARLRPTPALPWPCPDRRSIEETRVAAIFPIHEAPKPLLPGSAASLVDAPQAAAKRANRVVNDASEVLVLPRAAS